MIFGFNITREKKESEETALIVKEEKMTIPKVDEQTIRDYIFNSGIRDKITKQQEDLVLATAIAYNLNPIKKEIHVIPYYNWRTKKYDISMITGYEVYIKRAERSGDLEYWYPEEAGKISLQKPYESDYSCTVIIKRKSRTREFRWTVYFREVVDIKKKKNSNETYITSMWKKQPRFQTKKCCISQAFRLCFSDELGGMLYDGSELPDKMVDVTPTKTEPVKIEPAEELPEPGKENKNTQKSEREIPGTINIDPHEESEDISDDEQEEDQSLKCPRCGGQMVISQFNKNKKVDEYYCSNYKKLNCKEKMRIVKETGEVQRMNGQKKAKPDPNPDPVKVTTIEEFEDIICQMGMSEQMGHIENKMIREYDTGDFEKLDAKQRMAMYNWVLNHSEAKK